MATTPSETLVNRPTNVKLDLTMPLPLNEGCQIDLYLPRPLFIGPDLTSVVVGGMFGSLRDVPYTLDASRNLVKIAGACRSYR